jgi:hypothetical protein
MWGRKNKRKMVAARLSLERARRGACAVAEDRPLVLGTLVDARAFALPSPPLNIPRGICYSTRLTDNGRWPLPLP